MSIQRGSIVRRIIASLMIFAFLGNSVSVQAQGVFNLPQPGQMVPLSAGFNPVVLRGIQVHPENPFRFNFLVDSGDTGLKGDAVRAEAVKLIKYFLASLTIPEKDMWVNLSPYEKDRIIPNEFGQTEMGRDLLAQDYLLKQITATLIYPEEKLGQEFWQKVHAQARAKYGTTEIPINTFNKVWIVPDEAVVYENEGRAFVLKKHLKVMLEEDYLALENNKAEQKALTQSHGDEKSISNFSSDVVREVVLPALEKEVNEGKNFAQLRQVFYSLILATWYKTKIRESIFKKFYIDQNKIGGVDLEDKTAKEQIYQQYVEAFNKGVYNYIKEDYDQALQTTIPREYFSGGVVGRFAPESITYVGPDNQEYPLEALYNGSFHITNIEGDVRFLQQGNRRGSPAASQNEQTNASTLNIAGNGAEQDDDAGNGLSESWEALFAKVKAAPDKKKAIEEIVDKARPSINRIVLRYFYIAQFISEKIAGVPLGLELEDMQAEAVSAIVEAMNAPTIPDRMSYVARIISESVYHQIAELWDLPKTTVQQDLERVRDYLEAPQGISDHNFWIDRRHFIEEMDKQYPRLWGTVAQIKMVRPERLDDIPDSESMYPVEDENTLYEAELERIREALKEVLATLEKNERIALISRFQLGAGPWKTHAKLAENFGMTRSAIGQIEKRAISKLRQSKNIKVLSGDADYEELINDSQAGTTSFLFEIMRRLENLEKADQLPGKLYTTVFFLRGYMGGPEHSYHEIARVLDISEAEVKRAEKKVLGTLFPYTVDLFERASQSRQTEIDLTDFNGENLIQELRSPNYNHRSISRASLTEFIRKKFRKIYNAAQETPPRDEYLLEMLNALLVMPDLFEVAEGQNLVDRFGFRARAIAQRYMDEGSKEMSQSDLLYLNRTLLETIYPDIIERQVPDVNLLSEQSQEERTLRPSLYEEEDSSDEQDEQADVTPEQEDQLLARVQEFTNFSQPKREVLSYVLRGYTTEQIAGAIKSKEDAQRIEGWRRSILRDLRLMFTLGALDEFGSRRDVLNRLVTLTAESDLERMLRRTGMMDLLQVAGQDVDGVVELITQLYPGLYQEKDVRYAVSAHLSEIASMVEATPREHGQRLVNAFGSVIQKIGNKRAERRKLVLRRLLREFYYPIIVEDISKGSNQTVEVLRQAYTDLPESDINHWLYKETYLYYKRHLDNLKNNPVRGFQQTTEFGDEPLLAAQQFGIWDTVQLLEDERQEGALQASQARVGKTIMSVLGAFNVKDPGTGAYAVKRLLYTTRNQSKYEAADEIRRRTNKELDLHVIVIDLQEGERKDQIAQAAQLAMEGKNVVLVANYESVRDYPDDIAAFAPDAHIIDEVENLRNVDTVRAPIIFGVPAKYRIGISARMVVNEPEDVIEFLLWAKHHELVPPGVDINEARFRLQQKTSDELFELLDSLKIRWRRKTVMPQIKDPEEKIEHIPYSPSYEEAIRGIRTDFVRWKQDGARADKATDRDHLWARFEFERRASLDLGLVLPEYQWTFTPREGGDPVVLGLNDRAVRFGDRTFSREQNAQNVVLKETAGSGREIELNIHETAQPVRINGQVYDVAVKRLKNYMDESAKIKRLDEIIESELSANGKVLVRVDFVEGIDRLVERYNQKYGEGTAQGLHQEVKMKDRESIRLKFRSEAQPRILFGTKDAIGYSVNLFQVPGVPFHIKTMVRLVESWAPMDDADRVVGIGQTYQTRAITLMSQFSNNEIPTIEELVHKKVVDKIGIFDHVIDGAPIISDEEKNTLVELAEELTQGAADVNSAVTASSDTKGGIDFDPGNFSVEIQNQGSDFQFNIDTQTIEDMQIDGAEFFIINTVPMTNLPLFLGLSETEPGQQLSLKRNKRK